MLNPDTLSPVEFKFIKTYVAAMKRDFNELAAVLQLMDPARLGVRCVVRATKLACQLADLQDEFDARLAALGEKHTFKRGSDISHPTPDDVAWLFTLSFFKVVTKTPAGKSDNGLFSGEPESWQQVFKSLQAANTNDKLTKLLSIYAQTFFNNTPKMFKAPPDTQLPPGSFSAIEDYVADTENDDWSYETDDENDEAEGDDWPDTNN